MKVAVGVSLVISLALLAHGAAVRLHTRHGPAAGGSRWQRARALLDPPRSAPRHNASERQRWQPLMTPLRTTSCSLHCHSEQLPLLKLSGDTPVASRIGLLATHRRKLLRRGASKEEAALHASALTGSGSFGESNKPRKETAKPKQQQQQRLSGRSSAKGDAKAGPAAAEANELVVLRRLNRKKLPLSELEARYANEAMGRRRLQSSSPPPVPPSEESEGQGQLQQNRASAASSAAATGPTLDEFLQLLALRDDCAEHERARRILAESGVEVPRQLAVALAECRRGVAQLREIALAWAVEDGLVSADEAARAGAILAQLQQMHEEADRRRGISFLRSDLGGEFAVVDKQYQQRSLLAGTLVERGRKENERGLLPTGRRLRDWAAGLAEGNLRALHSVRRALLDGDASEGRSRMRELRQAVAAAAMKQLVYAERRHQRLRPSLLAKRLPPAGGLLP